MSDQLLENHELIEERIPPTHPGDVLREDYLIPLGMTASRLAKGLGMSQTAIQQILDGKRSITANVALRISRFFGSSAQVWMNLQSQYDLEIEKERRAKDLESIIPYDRAA